MLGLVGEKVNPGDRRPRAREIGGAERHIRRRVLGQRQALFRRERAGPRVLCRKRDVRLRVGAAPFTKTLPLDCGSWRLKVPVWPAATWPTSLPLASAWIGFAVLFSTTTGKSDLYRPTHPETIVAATHPATINKAGLRRIVASISLRAKVKLTGRTFFSRNLPWHAGGGSVPQARRGQCFVFEGRPTRCAGALASAHSFPL